MLDFFLCGDTGMLRNCLDIIYVQYILYVSYLNEG